MTHQWTPGSSKPPSQGGGEHPQGQQVSLGYVSTQIFSLLATKRLVGRFYLCVKHYHRILYELFAFLKPEH